MRGSFDPNLVTLLPPGYRPRDASGSEMSDDVSVASSESEHDRSDVNTIIDISNWLIFVGLSDYVRMYKGSLFSFLFLSVRNFHDFACSILFLK